MISLRIHDSRRSNLAKEMAGRGDSARLPSAPPFSGIGSDSFSSDASASLAGGDSLATPPAAQGVPTGRARFWNIKFYQPYFELVPFPCSL